MRMSGKLGRVAALRALSLLGSGSGVNIASTQLTDTANLARLNTANVFAESQTIQKTGQSAELLVVDSSGSGATSTTGYGFRMPSTGYIGWGSGSNPGYVNGAISNDSAGTLKLTTDVDATYAYWRAKYKSSDGTAGISGTMTTASLVGKTLTFKDGIITGFA